ncbi:archease [Candidatus Woesearchaeota archaeon]|nr:archease [Candidatus Woesearchaeota archaeon]
MPRYRILDDVAIADICFIAEGKDLNELFAHAAFAVEDIMMDTKTVKPRVERTIRLEQDKEEDLLYDFLSELVFIKDTDGLVFSDIKVTIQKGKTCSLTAVLRGETLDPNRQTLRADVKAITLHMFKIEKTKTGWLCQVVVDI